jgi:hypothetical protein
MVCYDQFDAIRSPRWTNSSFEKRSATIVDCSVVGSFVVVCLLRRSCELEYGSRMGGMAAR